MNRRYGVYGLWIGLILAALVVIGMYTTLFGFLIEAASIDTPPPGDSPPEADTEWNLLSIAGAVLSVAGLAHVVVLPVSMYADTRSVRQRTDWQPFRALWVPLSAVPFLQLPVTIVYLLRRTYLLTLRPLLIGQQTGADSGVRTTDTPRTTAQGAIPPSAEEPSPSLSQRIVSVLERILRTAFYLFVSYFLGFGVAFGIGHTLGVSDAVLAVLSLVLWAVSFLAIRRWRR